MPPRVDLLDPAVLSDPYPLFHRLRTEDPVHWEADLEFWALTRYADALYALREDSLLSSAIHDSPRPGGVGLSSARWFVFLDPPRHTRLRALVHSAFTPQVVEGLRARIQAIVDELLDRAAEAGRLDLIADLGFPLPAIVIAELLGVPAEDRAQFRAWSADLAAAGGFYLLQPFIGYSGLFVMFVGLWVALGLLNGRVLQPGGPIGGVFVRSVLAAIGSGLAFYAISGIWFPFRPHGWDYAIHFTYWTVAYLPGFAALLVRMSSAATVAEPSRSAGL